MVKEWLEFQEGAWKSGRGWGFRDLEEGLRSGRDWGLGGLGVQKGSGGVGGGLGYGGG